MYRFMCLPLCLQLLLITAAFSISIPATGVPMEVFEESDFPVPLNDYWLRVGVSTDSGRMSPTQVVFEKFTTGGPDGSAFLGMGVTVASWTYAQSIAVNPFTDCSIYTRCSTCELGTSRTAVFFDEAIGTYDPAISGDVESIKLSTSFRSRQTNTMDPEPIYHEVSIALRQGGLIYLAGSSAQPLVSFLEFPGPGNEASAWDSGTVHLTNANLSDFHRRDVDDDVIDEQPNLGQPFQVGLVIMSESESDAHFQTWCGSGHEHSAIRGGALDVDDVAITVYAVDSDDDGIPDNLDLCPDTWDPTNADGPWDDDPDGYGEACLPGNQCTGPATDYWWGQGVEDEPGEPPCPDGYTQYIVGSGPNKQNYKYCDLDITGVGRADYFNYWKGSDPYACESLGEPVDCEDGYDPYGPGGPGDGPLAQWIARRNSINYKWYMYKCQE